MSDSELSTPAEVPNESEIEKCLRRIARDLTLKPDVDVTVNLVRSHAEKELGLDSDYFKHSPQWKARSKDIISAAVEAATGENDASPGKPEEPAPKAKAKASDNARTKRKSDGDEAPRQKRAKKEVPKQESDDLESSEQEEETDPKPAKRVAKKPSKNSMKNKSSDFVKRDDDDDDVKSQSPPAKAEMEKTELSDVPDDGRVSAPITNGKPAQAEDDESDLSSLIDDPPPKKKRQKKLEINPKSGAKATKPAKSKPAGKELTADEEEIKRLQGWLVKCGIRKLWHKELASCSTAKEKIKHLKGMLSEVGMTGRYSAEKARQIKESRELAEEIEAAREYNERWGKEREEHSDKDDSDESDGARASKIDAPPKRRLPKGFVDFGDSGDEGSD